MLGSRLMEAFDLIPLILSCPEGEGTSEFVEVGLYDIGCVRF